VGHSYLSSLFCWSFGAIPPVDSIAEDNLDVDIESAGFFARVTEHISMHGGLVIFSYMMARVVGCLGFLGFSLASFIITERGLSETNGMKIGKHWGSGHRNNHRSSTSSHAEWLQVAMCISSVYASLLALISISARPSYSRLITRHLIGLLLVTFSVYVYRDLLPLATFTLHPKDQGEGWILWAKIITLTGTAVVIPLSIPRQYIPFDPKDPSSEPSPEQTTCIASLILFNFLDPIVSLANHIPHLSHEQLPPLADYDYARNLIKRSFPHLDQFTSKERKGKHIFFGLMKVFKREYIVLSFMIMIHVVAGFASPLGTNRLLHYLETRGKDAFVRPWVWIMWLVVGPMISSLGSQWYMYIATRTLVRTEGIITQLVFEHSLRIRMKTQASGATTSSSEDMTAAPTLDSVSIADGTEGQKISNSSRDQTQTVQSSSASVNSILSKIKHKARDVKIADDTVTKKEGTADNLVGKINNLVTTDLGNIVDGRDFLLVALYIPVQIILCIWFLYVILGWSSIVGLITMLLLFPIPGYVAGLIQKVQVTRMKKTDARIQTVTETMNVLRMVKLFGWESKMNEKIAGKREEELTWLWNRKVLDLLNGNINYMIPIATMLATYSTYTLIMREELSASIVFSSMCSTC